MAKRTLADEIVEFAEQRTADLSDDEYVETLEEVIQTLVESVVAKKEEMER